MANDIYVQQRARASGEPVSFLMGAGLAISGKGTPLLLPALLTYPSARVVSDLTSEEPPTRNLS